MLLFVLISLVTCAPFILTMFTLLSKRYPRVSSPFTDSGVSTGDVLRFYKAGFLHDGACDMGKNTPCGTVRMTTGTMVHGVFFFWIP